MGFSCHLLANRPRFDTFLLPPTLLQYFHGADVLTEAHLFDSHAPMRLHLRPPGRLASKWMWPLPRPYTEVLRAPILPPCAYDQASPSSVRQAYSAQVPENKCGDKVRLWSATVEKAVAFAVRAEHVADPTRQSFRTLPKSHRGRCRNIDRRQACPPRLPRPARHGDPEPVAEVTSVRSRQRLRQLRRLTTFAQGLRKHHIGSFRGPSAPDGWPLSLTSEWRAVQSAAGYGVAFADWVLQFPCFTFTYFPEVRPSLDFVQDLLSFVRYDLEALSRQEAIVRAKAFRYQLQVDAKDFSGSQCFVRVKPPQKPPFSCIQVRSQQRAQVLQQHSFQLWSLQVEDASKYDLHCQVYFTGVLPQVVLFAQDEDCVRPLSGSLLRDRRDCSWRAVVGGLMDYWSPIWNRDSRQEEVDIEAWPRYSQLLQTVLPSAPELAIDMRDVSSWIHVARSLSIKKAVGVCGWHNVELKGLPRAALQDLADIFAAMPAYPADLMRARAAVLSKVFEPSAASEARPITILSGLYRLWARVLCSQVLLTWSQTMPPGITGCLKQRSATDLSFSLQAQVEEHLHEGTDFSGLCLDLRKAFNLLPRAPLGCTLRALGLPPTVCNFWLASLQGLHRHFSVHASLGPGLPSSTGAPEGDPISVLGMLSICWTFVKLLEGLVCPTAYMDNWSWSTDFPDCHGPALLVLQDLTDSLRVQIDWSKTYSWGTTRISQDWWRSIGSAFVPLGVAIPVVTSAKELGSFFQFGHRPDRKPFQDKVLEAVARLQRLSSDPQVLPLKAKVAQAGIYPFLFYGTESQAPALTTMNNLRGAVARAVVGGHHTLSAHAALFAVRHVQDPEIFVLLHHLRQLRRAFTVLPHVASQVWLRVLGPEIAPRAVCGPAGALQVLLRRNGWIAAETGVCKGPLHCVFC